MELDFQPPHGADKLSFGTPRIEVRSRVFAGNILHTPANEPENDMYESKGLILGLMLRTNLSLLKLPRLQRVIFLEFDC